MTSSALPGSTRRWPGALRMQVQDSAQVPAAGLLSGTAAFGKNTMMAERIGMSIPEAAEAGPGRMVLREMDRGPGCMALPEMETVIRNFILREETSMIF